MLYTIILPISLLPSVRKHSRFHIYIVLLELSQMQSKVNQHQILTGHATKLRSKFLRGRHKQMKTNFLPSSEQEQNKVLERMSPEYKYEDNENTDSHENHISSLLDEKTIQSLTSKHLLDSGSQQSTRAMPALSITKELKHVGNHPSSQSLEHLNIMLQNTLPEYQYDRAERGQYTEIVCFYLFLPSAIFTPD